jgi:hypothetical protein
MVITRTTTPQTSRDCDHNNSNTSDNDYISCHSYHLMAVFVTMSKYVLATMMPMMGEREDNNNKYKSHRDHDNSNKSDYDCFS